MTDRPRAAGGFFLIVAVLAGFSLGLATGLTLQWTIAGLFVGIVAATLVWLIDRRTGR